MFSNSSDELIAPMLADSIRQLRMNHPLGLEDVEAHASGMAVRIAVDREDFVVDFGESPANVGTDPGNLGDVDVEIVTSRETINAILSGQAGLVDSVLSGQLEITGRIERIAQAHDTLTAYIYAMAELPTHADLQEQLEATNTERNRR